MNIDNDKLDDGPSLGKLNLIRTGLILRRLSIASGVPSHEIWRRFYQILDWQDLQNGLDERRAS